MNTLLNLFDKANTKIYQWQMKAGAITLAVLMILLVVMRAVEVRASDLTPQTKSDYAKLYYQFVQDYLKDNVIAPDTSQEKHFMCADLADLDNDGQYEFLVWYADKDMENALISVWTLNAIKAFYNSEEYNRQDDPAHKLGFGAAVNYDAYIIKYNGRDALVRSNAGLRYRQILWIADDGTAMETVIRENLNPNAQDDNFYLIEGPVGTYSDSDYSMGNVEPLDKYRSPEATELYYKTGEATSTWGFKATDRWRVPEVTVNFTPEVTYGERLLDYITE